MQTMQCLVQVRVATSFQHSTWQAQELSKPLTCRVIKTSATHVRSWRSSDGVLFSSTTSTEPQLDPLSVGQKRSS